MNITNVTSLSDVITYDNEITGGFAFGIVTLITVFSICFMATSQYRKTVSFVLSMFFTYIVSMFLATLGLIGSFISYSVLALFVISIILLFLDKEGEG